MFQGRSIHVHLDHTYGINKFIKWENKAFLMISNGKSRRFYLEETMKRSH